LYISTNAPYPKPSSESKLSAGSAKNSHPFGAGAGVLGVCAWATVTTAERRIIVLVMSDETQTPATEEITPDSVRLTLRKVKDPELNLNIVDLGLVYNIVVDEGNKVIVDMSLTSPGCPAGPQIMHDAERTIQAMPGVGKVVINLVWEPYWTPERIEPKVRAYMGI
jgi:metal-sulfur cluster biosynthetic enzyme